MNQLSQPRKEKSIQVLHPRVIAGKNGTVAGVNALALSLDRSKKNDSR